MYLNYFSFNLEIMFSNKFLFLLFERTDYMYIYVYIYITYLYKVSIFDSVLSFTGKNLCKLTCYTLKFKAYLLSNIYVLCWTLEISMSLGGKNTSKIGEWAVVFRLGEKNTNQHPKSRKMAVYVFRNAEPNINFISMAILSYWVRLS